MGGPGSGERAAAPPAVVALVASAGGLDALTAVVSAFAEDFPAAVILAQHLGPDGSALVEIVQRRTKLPVCWAREGMLLEPGRVVIAPPQTAVRVLPGATLSVLPTPNSMVSGPLDTLLTSLAGSLGSRATAAVLSGMGSDGALGARALKDAGATVIAQSEDSARHGGMPRAAVQVGAADLVLDILDIGPVLDDVIRGGQPPRVRVDRARTSGD